MPNISSLPLSIVDYALVTVAVALAYKLRAQQVADAPRVYPPGPKSWPIIGNLLDFSRGDLSTTFFEWRKCYGRLTYASTFGIHFLVVNDYATAVSLLEHQGVLYSDRPQLRILDITGWSSVMTVTNLGARFREMRLRMKGTIGNKSVLAQFQSGNMAYTRRFLRQLLLEPNTLSRHVSRLMNSIIMNLSYGHDVREVGRDPLAQTAEVASHDFEHLLIPSSHLLNFMPWLEILLKWLPGTGYTQWLRDVKARRETFLRVPLKMFREAQVCLAAGTAKPSFFLRNLSRSDVSPAEEETIAWTAIEMNNGPTDTLISIIQNFFLGATQASPFPQRAQAEISSAVGENRLPALQDRERLPFVTAVVKEVWRWDLTMPINVPHVAAEEGTYDGYFIPKGTWIIAHLRAFTHDPDIYPDPDSFEPSRFIRTPSHEPEKDPSHIVFGFGRRKCPGILLAEDVVWLVCAMTLASVIISKARDSKGSDIEPTIQRSGLNIL
ncbi:cytochrome P450 [Exidia glandulosa HHB12029]|uniref:Cytochrome P450 n=1 Tax=Exidia glandulosa HHB12029 TaxID=1314781 RepID=A0A165GH10_EXIGL|nr:cytochrome P450 [Exidia glandulosa HHB12029]